MKKILLFITAFSAAFSGQSQCLTNQTVTANPTLICGSGSSNITTTGSNTPGQFWLRNDADNSVVAGPVAGGGPLSFNTGTISSTTTYHVYGELPDSSRALQFNGTTQYVQIPASTAFNFGTGDFTVEAWFRTSSSADMSLIGRGDGSSGLALLIIAGQPVLWVGDELMISPAVLNDGVWHHVAGVRQSGNLLIYVDGVLSGTPQANVKTVPSSGPLYLGDWEFASWRFAGRIDEVRIWNVARSQLQINDKKDRCIISGAGLVAKYGMEEGTGSVLNDLVGSNNGTLMNMTGASWVASGLVCPGCNGTLSQTVTVTVNPIPDATFAGLAANYCSADATATLAPNQAGGIFSGTGVSGTQFNPSTANLGNNDVTYSITVGGCSNSSMQSTNVISTPNANFSGLAANYCSDDAASTLSPVQAGGTFSGTGVSGNIFDPTSASIGSNTVTYDVTVSGCSASSNQITTVNALPDATFSGLTATHCADGSSVTLTPSTGGGTFSGTGISGNDFDPSSASIGNNDITYSITVNGCASATTQSTTVNPVPDASFTGLNVSYCDVDAPVTLVPVVAGGTFSGTGITGNDFDPSAAGCGNVDVTYSVTVSGCSAMSTESTFVGNAPSVTLTPTNPLCFGDSNGQIDLSVVSTCGTYNVDWAHIAGTSNPEDLTGLVAGNYSVTVTSDGCAATVGITLSEPAVPVLVSNVLSQDPNACGASDGQIQIDVMGGTPGYTFDWSDGAGFTATTQNIAGLPAGNYMVVATDVNGCEGSASYFLHDPNGPTVSLNVSGSNLLVDCKGDLGGVIDINVTLNGGATSADYLWSNAEVTEDIAGIGAGTYSVLVTDNNGCTGGLTVDVMEPLAITANATPTDEMMGNDGAINLVASGGTGALTYSWTGPNGFMSTDQNLSGLEAGLYEVTITDDNGCELVLQVIVGGSVKVIDTNSIQVNAYPNPTSGWLRVQTSVSDGQVIVRDAIGRVVLQKAMNGSATDIDLSIEPNGIYFVEFRQQQIIKVIRVVVAK